MLSPLPGGLRVVRTLQARRAEVFDAWTDPERLRAWWGPPGITVSEVHADLRVGGSYRIVMTAPGSAPRVLVWTFREIAPPDRLVYAWHWAEGPEGTVESIVTVRFRDRGERTEVEVTHTGFDDDSVRDNHAQGWLGCLGELDKTLNHMV
jgi:uncharacterized protein YndB with AHSA1/START domain